METNDRFKYSEQSLRHLSLVLLGLTKHPFEPLSEAPLWLNYKAVFLLALASGNRRSEIYAWTRSPVSSRSNWSEVTVSPPAFLHSLDRIDQQVTQVRAHDVRAMAASLAFKGGVSLDQVLSSCY